MVFNKDEFIEKIESMTVVELNELVEALKEKFGVTAPVAVEMAAGGDKAEAEEKTEFNVVLKETGANKIGVIKVIKAITGLGLKESKEIAEAPGKSIKEGVDKATAEEFKKQIEEAGATVELT